MKNLTEKIIMIFGCPGSGKTTVLAKAATDNLNGKSFLGIRPHSKVYTTFACPGCYVLEPAAIGVYDFTDALLIIDEASQFFDARDWAKLGVHQRTWFQLHRHVHCSVIMCSQGYSDCDLRIRNLCQQFYLLTALPFGHFSVIKPIKSFITVDNNSIQDGYEFDSPINWKLIYRKKYYPLFDSFSKYVEYLPNEAPLYPGENHLLKRSRGVQKVTDL